MPVPTSYARLPATGHSDAAAATEIDVFAPDRRVHAVVRVDPRAERGHLDPSAPPLVSAHDPEQLAERQEPGSVRHRPERLLARGGDVRSARERDAPPRLDRDREAREHLVLELLQRALLTERPREARCGWGSRAVEPPGL